MTANVHQMIHSRDIPEPWHGLSSAFEDSDTFDDRIKKAGFDYTVESAPAFYLADGEPIQAPDRLAFYRHYNDATNPRHRQFEAVMSNRFHPLQPVEMMRFYEDLERETGCPLHVAGSLGGGTFFATAKIDLDASNAAWEVAGESHRRYWLVASRNDGSMATRIGPTDVQVVCQNTLHMALGAGGVASVNHRSKVDWGEVRADLDRLRGDFPAFDGLLELFNTLPVDTAYAAEFVHDIAAPQWNPEVESKTPRTVKKLSESILHSPGQRERGQTAYALLSGTTHYVDHGKQARSDENRFNAAQWGPGASLKRAAWDKLLQDCVTKWNQGEVLHAVTRNTSYAPVIDELLKAA